jgi:hypothetical protein
MSFDVGTQHCQLNARFTNLFFKLFLHVKNLTNTKIKKKRACDIILQVSVCSLIFDSVIVLNFALTMPVKDIMLGSELKTSTCVTS